MNAPHRIAMCELGHALVGSVCLACEKAPRDTKLHERARRASKARRAARKTMPCPMHLDETVECPRCMEAKAAITKELAETVPYWQDERRGDAMRRSPTREMIEESRRMFLDNAVPIRGER